MNSVLESSKILFVSRSSFCHRESAKLRVLRAHVSTCLACLRALRAHVPTCLRAYANVLASLRAHVL